MAVYAGCANTDQEEARRKAIAEMMEREREQERIRRHNEDVMAQWMANDIAGKEGLLPDKASDLLALALEDGIRMGRRRYVADSGFYHKPEKIDKRRTVVRVGVAGMALAKTLRLRWNIDADIHRAPEPIKNKLVALDCAGEGDARGAVLALRGKTSIEWFHGPDMALLERFYKECDDKQLALLDKWAKVDDFALSFQDWDDYKYALTNLREFEADLRGAGW